MPQLDTLIIMPILLGLLPLVVCHYAFLTEVYIPLFFGTKKFRTKFIALKKGR